MRSGWANGGAAVLELSNVSVHFGGLQVLQDVNFQVSPGSIFGLIGPNGAGKTTIFNLITGLLTPAAGTIQFDDRALVGMKPHRIMRLGLARTFQNIRLFKEMTLLQNVVVGAYRHKDYGVAWLLLGLQGFRRQESAARERALELLTWMKLDHKAHELANNLSYGEQRRLELARALASEPRLLLLDEPVAGVAQREVEQLGALLLRIRDELGCAMVVIEHDMPLLSSISDRLMALELGECIAEGEPAAVLSDPRVIASYLGEDVTAVARSGAAPVTGGLT
jgi:branched-chain amino acid transport system ATP-binding protein